jgi:hypothetical protein
VCLCGVGVWVMKRHIKQNAIKRSGFVVRKRMTSYREDPFIFQSSQLFCLVLWAVSLTFDEGVEEPMVVWW